MNVTEIVIMKVVVVAIAVMIFDRLKVLPSLTQPCLIECYGGHDLLEGAGGVIWYHK